MSGTGRNRRAIGLLALIALALSACESAPTGLPPEGVADLALPWITVDPAAVALDANALFLAGEKGGEIPRLRSLLVARNGRIAWERYYGDMTRDSLADVRSVTKSIVSTLAGIALESGAISDLDQPITDFLSDDEFPLQPDHRFITVRHLLTMSSGLQWSENSGPDYGAWITSEDQVDFLLARPFVAEPGSAFTYNSAAVHLLGIVIEKAVRRPLATYADEVLFGPLGITERRWEALGDGTVNGGAGIDLRPRDLLRFGQLHLQNGWSGDRRLVPAGWVDRARADRWGGFGRYGLVDDLSYGFLWWLDVPRGAYFAWGHGGQFIYVLPALELVVVATTEWRGASADVGASVLQRAVLDLIIGSVLPALDEIP